MLKRRWNGQLKRDTIFLTLEKPFEAIAQQGMEEEEEEELIHEWNEEFEEEEYDLGSVSASV